MAAKRKKNAFLKEVEIKYKIIKVPAGKHIGKPISSPETVVQLFSDLQNEAKEKLIVINLDAKNKILCFEVVAIGTVNTISVRPMEVFRTSIVVNAYGAIVVHNHPSGDCQPSFGDKQMTAELLQVANAMGLTLYDHIIIGQDDFFSFAKENAWASKK